MKLILKLYFFFLFSTTCFAENFIYISEIFPNPKGQDTNQEWIEIYNPSNQTINLENFKIKTNSNEIILKNFDLKAKNTKIIQKDIKLNNTNENIQFKTPQNKTIQEINFQNSQEEKSYSLQQIKEENLSKQKWIWNTPSKNIKNPNLIKLNATIFLLPQIEKNLNFYIQTKNTILKIIIKDEESFLFLEKTLKLNQEVEITIEENSNELVEISPINQKIEITKKDPNKIIILSILPITLILSLVYQKTIKVHSVIE